MIDGACSPIVVANPRHMDDESRERPGSPKGAGEVERLAGEDGRRRRHAGYAGRDARIAGADLVLTPGMLSTSATAQRNGPRRPVFRFTLPKGRTAGGEDQRRRELTMPCWIAL